MLDSKYCYENSSVLKNRLNIRNSSDLFDAEKELTAIRLKELQDSPIEGAFDFKHLQDIHKYIFQDLYEWAGEVRTVEIGKGNLFCTTQYIFAYADTIFKKYYKDCYSNKDNFNEFVKVFSENYADLNALHPFREGNGRTQREFARLVCLSCGYKFSLQCTTHKEMLSASILSFNQGDNSALEDIFKKAITTFSNETIQSSGLDILTLDDMDVITGAHYDYYDDTYNDITKYNEVYKAKLVKMNEEIDK